MGTSILKRAYEPLHHELTLKRRVRILAREIAARLPDDCTVLDVGCGGGEIARAVAESKRNVSIRGVEVVVRPGCAVPVEAYDGKRIPAADKSHDFVTIVDVLHHTDDPLSLMREAARVARRGIVLKDHNCNSHIQRLVMTCTDTLGNWHHGVPLLFNFWGARKWREAWDELGLVPEEYSDSFGLYSRFRGCIFARDMDFIVRLSSSGLRIRN